LEVDEILGRTKRKVIIEEKIKGKIVCKIFLKKLCFFKNKENEKTENIKKRTARPALDEINRIIEKDRETVIK
jgi:hypothetical protein